VRYSVREVVRATGITEHTLRAWERRYSAIAPERSEGGTRRYTRSDLARLLLLKRAVDEGQRISSIAGHTDAEIEELLSAMSGGQSLSESRAPTALWRSAFEEIVRFDAAEAERQLSQHFSALGPVAFGKQVALPLMAAIGQAWHDGEVTPAAEHMATEIVRSLLGIAIRSQPRGPHAFTLITTTLPGERHEAGLLVACLIAIEAGLRVVHLGVELPPADVARAARQIGADAVLLALTAPGEGMGEQIGALALAVPESIEIWTGGAEPPSGLIVKNHNHFNSIDDIEAHIRSIESD